MSEFPLPKGAGICALMVLGSALVGIVGVSVYAQYRADAPYPNGTQRMTIEQSTVGSPAIVGNGNVVTSCSPGYHPVPGRTMCQSDNLPPCRSTSAAETLEGLVPCRTDKDQSK